MRPVVFLLLASCSLWAADKAVYDITSLVVQENGDITLMGGKSVGIPLVWGPETKVVFEDSKPGANWEHPAAIKVISRDGTVLQEVKTSRPPAALKNAKQIEGPTFDTKTPPFSLSSFQGRFRVANPKNFYALLINGQADQRHWNDFSFFYRVLTEVYGYSKENIFVADGNFKGSQEDLDGDGKSDIQYGSHLKDIKDVMALLKGKLTQEDHLVLAVNDHGGTSGNQSTIILQDGEITASDFAKLLNQLKVGKLLALYEQCFSGGFVRPSVKNGWVAAAGATNLESSWASMDLNWDEWIYYVVAGFAMQTHDGKAISIDVNKDNKISAQEAMGYSIAKDLRPESPLLEAYVNSGDSNEIGLGF